MDVVFGLFIRADAIKQLLYSSRDTFYHDCNIKVEKNEYDCNVIVENDESSNSMYFGDVGGYDLSLCEVDDVNGYVLYCHQFDPHSALAHPTIHPTDVVIFSEFIFRLKSAGRIKGTGLSTYFI